MKFGLFQFRSPLLSESIFLPFPPGNEMFQFPGFPTYDYLFIIRYCNITCSEFPHSDICGSTLICSSPQLFAACHVLLRRHVPRHPPYALRSLLLFLRRYISITTAFRQYSLALIKNSRLSFLYFFDLAVCLCIHFNTFVLTFILKYLKSFYCLSVLYFKVILNSLLISLDY